MNLKSTKGKVALLILTLTLLGLLFVFAVGFGSVRLTFSECVRGLFFGTGAEGIIIRSLRLPRAVGAVLSGAALAVSGLLLQSSLSNDLAAPNTIGINSGAGAAVMLSLCFITSSFIYQSLFAFLGALLASALTLTLASRAGGKMSKSGVVLAGVAVGALFGAVISYLSVRYPDVLASYAAFSIGGFSGVVWADIRIPAVVIVLSLIAAELLGQKLNILSLGDTMAASLGVKTAALRVISVVLASALAASSVSYAGLIGFVGLISPHAASRIIGSDKRFLLPMSALLGAFLVTLSDLLGRVLFAPGEIPSGIILNAVGAPFFLVLLISKARRYDR